MRKTAHRNTGPLLALMLVAAPLSAQTASLVKDINPLENPFFFSPGPLYANGDKLYVFGYEAGTGKEPWITDGTSTGTELLVDTCPGICDGDSVPLGHLGNVIFWATENVSGESALWRSDGTRAGTFSVIGPERGIRAGGIAVASDHLLFFGACSAAAGCELWASDGTPAGTRLVKDLTPGPGDSDLNLITAGGKVFFSLRAPDGDKSVWVTDGTAAGTVLLKDLGTEGSTFIAPVFAAGSRLVFFASTPAEGTELWASDGTAAGTLQITRFPTPAPFSQVTASGHRLYFVADDSVHGRQLWRTDGTVAGTQRLTAFTAASPFNASEQGMVGEIGDLAVFIASDSGTLPKLWVSGGSPQSVKALPAPAPASSLFTVNGRLYFIADDGVHGREPWTTDGTAAGTRMLRDSCPGTCGITDDPPFIVASGTLLFRAGGPKKVLQLWQIDGTTAGIRQITDFDDQASSIIFSPIYLAVSGRKLFFLRDKVTTDLWVSEDGKTPHQVLAGAQGKSSAVADLVPYHGLLYFTAEDETRRDVWKSDGSPEGTLPVTSGFPVDPPSGPRGLTAAGQFLFFLTELLDPDDNLRRGLSRTDGTAGGTVELLSADRPILEMKDLHGVLYFMLSNYGEPQPAELWRSDGTPAGTSHVFTFGRELNVNELQAAGDRLYCLSNLLGDYATTQLWQSDGTTAGTFVLAALPDRDTPELRLAKLGTRLFFLNHGSLWSSDGTPGGTGVVSPIATKALDLLELGGSLYVLAETDGRRELWRSDGTAPGTVRLAVFLGPVLPDPNVSRLTAAAGKLFFTADDGVHGAELWTSDGTAAGTVLVQDIFAGPGSSHPSRLTAVGDRLFFTAFDSAHGFELRQSDGTAAGTRLVQDIAPEGLSSTPDQLTVAGDRLFFTADDGQFGRELWSLPLTGPGGCQASSAHLCLNGGRYQVEAAWRDSQGHTGFGSAVPLSGDTGYFWFFSPSNVEAVVKVLDGQGVNGHVWVFYGALSNVEYTLTVTDTQTGLTRRYFNPQGQLASVGDVHGFGPLGAYGANRRPPVTVAPPSPLPLITERQEKAAIVPCQPSAQRLCLNGNRFAVEVAWKDFQGHTGKGTAVPLPGDSSGTTGTFWFFNAANVELVVKALDGRPVNGHFWLFYGALSNVEYTVTVTDTQTNKVRTYTNPSGRFASVADTLAY